MVHGRNACAKQKEALHEPSEFERCCGWVLPARGYPTQPRSVEKQVQGSNACAKRKEALHEPSSCADRRNPFRVVEARRLIPRVARSSQPWALLRNPFGILG